MEHGSLARGVVNGLLITFGVVAVIFAIVVLS